MMKIKQNLFVCTLFVSFYSNAQEVPTFLKGYDYYTTSVQAADGSSFEAFEVSDIAQAKALKKDIKQLRHRHNFRIDKSGLRITKRVIGEWTVMTFTGVDFRRVCVFIE
jgi:hypothetical protein